jgi:hypothetical protein
MQNFDFAGYKNNWTEKKTFVPMAVLTATPCFRQDAFSMQSRLYKRAPSLRVLAASTTICRRTTQDIAR